MPTRIEQLLQQASTDKRKLSSLKFPLDLDTEGTGNVIRFSINLPSGSKYLNNGEYKAEVDPATNQPKTSNVRRAGSNSLKKRFSDSVTRTTTKIDLFMPPTVQTSYGSDWGQEELGSLGAGSDATGGWGDSSWSDVWNAIRNTSSEALPNAIAGTFSTLTPFNFSGLRKISNNTMVNPYIEIAFNGVQNRTFSFSFRMIPRNADEQRMVKTIVDEFKFHQAPEFKFEGLSNYWLFPSTVDISFLNRQGENPWIYKISTCAMTNVTVNKSPEGNYASHEDGAPYATELTLEFMELEQLDKKRIREGY